MTKDQPDPPDEPGKAPKPPGAGQSMAKASGAFSPEVDKEIEDLFLGSDDCTQKPKPAQGSGLPDDDDNGDGNLT